ncbi:MAG: hypothetical protein WCF93_00780 [Candidatus Moraniibacteriota bacterium]
MKNFTRTEDFTKDEHLEIIRRAEIFHDGIKNKKSFAHLCPGAVIATEFFQESTRTAAIIQAAMIRLGGGWFGISGIKGTYLESGEEDLEDTLNAVAPLCDVMAVRHKTFDLTSFAEKGFRVPLINAMCGGEEHSIAGIAYTLISKKYFNELKGMKVGLYGMSKSSRPIKAVVKVMSYFGVEFYEDSVIPEFKMPEHIVRVIEKNGSVYKQEKLDDFIGKVDHLFVIEGLPQTGEDENLINKFNELFVPISKEHMGKILKNAIVDVIEPRSTTDGRLVALKETDDDSRMVGKELLEMGVYVTMAVITYLLDIEV